ncbi:pyridoxamine 5'-phosphate oxidase family protein [Subtercola sp. PAMC28395]|uniref:pyridoxamine 5'-phosphate oxidase family protein n=1 Tax=Subtercola sp. PAMC28395 TaxID=2846775 RepID=UPI001C0C2E83|nr:pyridoxamine 5'-phosphate oxidase family protein [Subtercola sp. PAMC28395]QWT24422.1 pyridoxamine 5'-phosphate oxidase family protein [Subtercola sp. PAMC28395]
MPDREDDIEEWSPQGPVTELSDARSWALVTGATFGRIGVSVDDQPEIFPVNYFSNGSAIVFRTASGTKLTELMTNKTVVFEVDASTDEGTWSVTVKGTAHAVTDDFEVPDAAFTALPDWVPTEPYVFVHITPTSIVGRLFHHHVKLARRD